MSAERKWHMVFYDGELPSNEQAQAMQRVKKRAFSRERCEELRAVGLVLDAMGYNPDICEEAAELLLDLRQAVRGGRRTIRGSRHWEDN